MLLKLHSLIVLFLSRLSYLQATGITHILNVSYEALFFPDQYTYKQVEVADAGYVRITRHFQDCVSFIDEATKAGGKVLIHCREGRSRSPTIAVAYGILALHLDLKSAVARVTAELDDLNVNDGFKQQLMDLEVASFGRASYDWIKNRSV